MRLNLSVYGNCRTKVEGLIKWTIVKCSLVKGDPDVAKQDIAFEKIGLSFRIYSVKQNVWNSSTIKWKHWLRHSYDNISGVKKQIKSIEMFS
jgi:hypothetical protein